MQQRQKEATDMGAKVLGEALGGGEEGQVEAENMEE